MPTSKNRPHPHHHHQPHDAHLKHSKMNKAVLAGIILFSIIGLGISYSAAGANIIWLAVGTIIGAVGGYFFGHQLNKAFTNK